MNKKKEFKLGQTFISTKAMGYPTMVNTLKQPTLEDLFKKDKFFTFDKLSNMSQEDLENYMKISREFIPANIWRTMTTKKLFEYTPQRIYIYSLPGSKIEIQEIIETKTCYLYSISIEGDLDNLIKMSANDIKRIANIEH